MATGTSIDNTHPLMGGHAPHTGTHQAATDNEQDDYCDIDSELLVECVFEVIDIVRIGGDTDGQHPLVSPTAYRPTLNRIWPHTHIVLWTNHPQYLDMYNKVKLTTLPNYLKARIPVTAGLDIPK